MMRNKNRKYSPPSLQSPQNQLGPVDVVVCLDRVSYTTLVFHQGLSHIRGYVEDGTKSFIGDCGDSCLAAQIRTPMATRWPWSTVVGVMRKDSGGGNHRSERGRVYKTNIGA